MKLHLNFSVFHSPNDAYGNIEGEMDVSIVPVAGDMMSFAFSNAAKLPETAFNGILCVEKRRIDVGEEFLCTLSLEDIIVDGKLQAENIIKYFENGFNFYGYRY